MNLNRQRARRGATLLESLTGAGISTLALLGGAAAFLQGTHSFARGAAAIDSMNASQLLMKRVTNELRESMQVTADPSGTSIQFKLPSVDANGDYIYPAAPESQWRKIELRGNALWYVMGTTERKLVDHVQATNSLTGSTYKIFKLGPGVIPHEIFIEIHVGQTSANGHQDVIHATDVVELRNAPRLSR